MNGSDSERDPLEQLADEFAQRYRQGERPTLTEYAQRHPELAGEIRELFPALVEMEQQRQVAAGASDADPVHVQPEQLGEYRIVREVARGGMGVVYEAVQESLGRHVALKVLPLHGLMNPHQLERFRREARAAARLHHTNIVPVFGVGEDQGIHYYAMQFIQGQSLDLVLHELRRLRGKPGWCIAADSEPARTAAYGLLTGNFHVEPEEPPEATSKPEGQVGATAGLSSSAGGTMAAHVTDEPIPTTSGSEFGSQSHAQYYRSVARLGVQVAEAMAYAHEQGVLHRDIKPSNLLLDTRGTAWVTDFGLAKDKESDDLTRTGDIVGTLRYMAPERFEGRSDSRSDVYGIGVTLYETATLEPAFDASGRAQLVQKITCQPPRAPRAVNRAIPTDLETIVLTAIAKRPEERYASAGEMAADLRRFLENRPIAARRPSAWQKLRKWSQRHRPLVVTTVASAAAMCLLAVSMLLRSNAQIRGALGREVQAKEDLQAALQREQQELYFHRVTLADREWLLNNVAKAERALDRCPVEIRRWEWFYLKNLMHREILAMPSHQGGVGSVVFSPDGSSILSAGKHVQLWDAGTGRLVRTFQRQTEGVGRASFSPDGSRIVFPAQDGTIRICERASGTTLHTLRPKQRIQKSYAVYSVAFSPDGSRIASAGEDELVRIWDANTGEQLFALVGHVRSVTYLVYSPDGRLLASGGKDNTLRLWDAAAGSAAPITHRVGVRHLQFDAAGKRIAVATSSGAIAIYEVHSGKLLTRIDGDAYAVTFDPTGRMVASSGHDRTVRIWSAKSGGQVSVLRGHTGPVTSVAYSPDGRHLVSAGHDGILRVWDATATSQEAITWPLRRPYSEANVAFRPDGGLLTVARGRDRAFEQPSAGVRVIDPAAGDVVLSLAGEVPPVTQVAVSRDGSRLATASVGGVVKVWDGNTGKELVKLEHAGSITAALSFSPNAKQLVIGNRKRKVNVYNAVTGDLETELVWPAWSVGSIAFSPDGLSIAVGGGRFGNSPGEIRIYNSADYRLKLRLAGHTRMVKSISFNPSGDRLASAGLDGTVRVWDTASATQLLALSSQSGATYAVVFSPDGQRLASAEVDRTIRIWDAASGRELLTLRGHSEAPHTVAFSPDGGLIASAAKGELKVWDGTPREANKLPASLAAAPGEVRD